jgi:diacylglycerol O-acyltransferase
MEQLGGLDATFIYCETPTMHLHVCGLLLLDTSTMPNGYSYDIVRSMLHERLPSVPAVRQRLVNPPLHVSRPFWVDDPRLDIDDHLHRVTLDSPGDEDALASLVGTIAGEPLRRDRPLWEMWVVEGLASGQVALVVKMHHSTIDGVSGANIMGHLFDLEPGGGPTSQPEAIGGVRSPRRLELLARGLVSRLSEPFDLVRLVPETGMRLASTLWHVRGRDASSGQPAAPFTAPRTAFNATISAKRSVAFTNVSFDTVKQVKDATGVTVNDVVTTVVGGALRRYLQDHGDLPEHSLLAAAPISVHGSGHLAGTTQVSVMFSNLVTSEPDPAKRLRAVAAANIEAKAIHKSVGADTLMRWAQHFWLNAFGLGTRIYSALHMADHHPVVHNLILSNVPGPPVPLYFAGARLAGLYPLGPITDGAGLNITVLSQEDRLGFGIVTCPDLIPRVWDLAEAVPQALEELRAATSGSGPRREPAGRTSKSHLARPSTRAPTSP